MIKKVDSGKKSSRTFRGATHENIRPGKPIQVRNKKIRNDELKMKKFEFEIRNSIESGASLVFSLILMAFLTLISYSLVRLVNYESHQMVKSFLSQRALYAAEAGAERKIAQIREGSTSGISLTDFEESQYEVSVNSLGSDRYEIQSTGYVPTKSDAKEVRKISVVIYITPSTPEHALAFGGTGSIGSNTTIYGTIKSNNRIIIGDNVTITESEPGKGDASIYSAYNGPLTPVIDIGNKFHVGVSGQYIKCRYDSSQSPDEHAPKSSDDTPEIYDEDNIVEKLNVTIVENDNSSDTDPITVPSADIDSILASAIEVTVSNYKTILNGGADTPWKLDSSAGAGKEIFYLDNNQTWNPEGNAYNFTRAVEFKSNSKLGPDAGTIVVSSGTSDYGIRVRSNLGGTGDTDRVEVNLLVTGGTWYIRDILFDSNIWINGYIYGSTDVEGDAKINLEGIIEAGEDVILAANVSVQHTDDIPLDIPWEEGSTGSIQIVSWQEISP
ncbi:MAG: pilus assembly PilX N-terminal domain-containing protein [Elusimicrobia bacterium]|nr:pilus assembly PilX N-terminal domain-containing protein [Elusimicrobiota bacterium]